MAAPTQPMDQLDAALLGAGLPEVEADASGLGVLGNFGVTDNQVSDQQLFTA